MNGMLHIYNDCTIDWHVQICEAVWPESRIQSTTPILEGRTHGRPDMNPMSPIQGHSPRGDNNIVLSIY